MSGYTAVAASEQDAKQREMAAPAMRANPAVLVPSRARVPRGHQGPPRFVENPRNPRTFPTPEEMKIPPGRGAGWRRRRSRPRPVSEAKPFSRRARGGNRAPPRRARPARRRERVGGGFGRTAQNPQKSTKRENLAHSFHTVIIRKYDACPRRDGPGARVTFLIRALAVVAPSNQISRGR